MALAKKDIEIPLPPVVRIEPASACNLRCTHCPTGVAKMTRSIMKPELFERVLSEVGKNVPPIRVAVLYHGGEPLLNRNFAAMARRVKDLGIPFVKTVSNGMLIRGNVVDELVTCGLDMIEISLDGTSAAENDRIRRRAKFTRIVAAIRALIEARARHQSSVQLAVATTQFLDLNKLQFDSTPAIPDVLRNAFADVNDQIQYKTTWAKLWPSEMPAERYDLLWDDREISRSPKCSLLEETMSIRADGQVVACCYDLTSMSNLGNIAEQSLADIWRGAAYHRFREDFETGNYPNLCKGCVVVTGDKYLIRPEHLGPQTTILASRILRKPD